MKMCIPSIGTQIKLTHDWTFSLFCERRNQSLWNIYGDNQVQSFWASECFLDNDHSQGRRSVDVTIKKDTILQIDRIYIRKGNDIMQSFDSLSFLIKSNPDGIKGRFWAKLSDVNTIEFDIVEQNINDITSYLIIRKDVQLANVVKVLHSKRINVVKSNKKFITVTCPVKRLTAVFSCKIKSTKTKGLEIQSPPLYYGHLVEQISFTEPDGDK